MKSVFWGVLFWVMLACTPGCGKKTEPAELGDEQKEKALEEQVEDAARTEGRAKRQNKQVDEE